MNSLNAAEASTFTVNPFPSAASSVNPSTVVTWQFLDNEGIWTEYQKPVSDSPPTTVTGRHSLQSNAKCIFAKGCIRVTLSVCAFSQQCSLDSTDIERQYQSNPQSQLAFTAGRFSYTLCFNGKSNTCSNNLFALYQCLMLYYYFSSHRNVPDQ